MSDKTSAHVPVVKLNDGREIPQIAFGTWKIPEDVCTLQVTQAVELGFSHIDTAQAYRNEAEVGKAIRGFGLHRDDFWVTTKWSGLDGKGPRQSCLESLDKLGLKQIDLYLIHSPRLANENIPGVWEEFESLKKDGLVKSIGVSNFSIADLKVLLYSAKIKPVVNQILFHPYVWEKTRPLVEFMEEHDIKAEAYSALYPLTSQTGGPVDKPVDKIAHKRNLKPEQVLLAWVIAHAGIPITTSSRPDRITSYLSVPHIHLSKSEVESIDEAGKKFHLKHALKEAVRQKGPTVAFASLVVAGWLAADAFGLI
ncbi:Aldo/keto reductase family proteins [Phaffia rhodozyma]|uniref:Aldo/keto reductase family proteins n=1 Tax=Phaffia rhodozyma TaxID=264483 RepID=A0A0F7SX22_PHARH|nr:Aldo/keto reductase family proteins [Phaffia rhodozyma]